VKRDCQIESDWKLLCSDEFDGETLDKNKWNRQIEKAVRFNEEWQRYTDNDDNTYIENKQLVIQAIHNSKAHGHNQYSSARLNTTRKFNFKCGKIVARMKLPFARGIWPAFWMLGKNIDENGGDTLWSFCGEIDILELYGTEDNGVVEANLRYADRKGKHEQIGAKPYKLKEGAFADAFHIFELEWNEKQIIWLIDVDPHASLDIMAKEFSEFHREFFLLLNVAVGRTYVGRPYNTSIFSQFMYVNWIRVYQKNSV